MSEAKLDKLIDVIIESHNGETLADLKDIIEEQEVSNENIYS